MIIERTIVEIAEKFGLVVEPANGSKGDQRSFRIYKGANQVFSGTEQSVRNFFDRYERERPGLFVESMYGYKE